MDRLPQKLPFSRRILSKKVVLTYIFDYAIIAILGLAYLALNLVSPYRQHFSLRNYTLQYPFAVHERVPLPVLYVTTIAAPAGIIALYTMVIDGLFSHSTHKRRKYKLKDRLWELNCGILGLLLSIFLSYAVTGTLKNAIGKPRPDLISRCLPKEGSEDPQPFGLSNSTICTRNDKAMMDDGFRSFPSGHSSTAFAGLYYLSLYLGGKLHVLDARGEVWRTFVVLIPSLGAALIAGSRIMDARHHPFDVITGSLLGIFTAWISYRQYFPPLHEFRAKGRAYPIRAWGKSLSDDPPLQATYIRTPMDEENVAKFTGRVAPPEHMEQGGERTGNVFRDEIRSSQRQRRQTSHATRGPASSAYSTDPLPVTSESPPPVPLHQVAPSEYQEAGNPFTRTMSHRRRERDDIWESSDEEEVEGYELEPSYTLSNPNQYDAPGYERFRAQDTGYHPQPQPTNTQATDGSDSVQARAAVLAQAPSPTPAQATGG